MKRQDVVRVQTIKQCLPPFLFKVQGKEKSRANQRAVDTVDWPLKSHSQAPSSSSVIFPHKSCTNLNLNSLASLESRDAMWVHLGQGCIREDMLEWSGGKILSLCEKDRIRELHYSCVWRWLCEDTMPGPLAAILLPWGKGQEKYTIVSSRPHEINGSSSKSLSSDFLLLEQYVPLSFKPLLTVFPNIHSLMHANQCGAEISKH